MMKSKRKTNYSPIRQMKRAGQDDSPAIELKMNHRNRPEQSEELQSLEEVYICDCCGVTRELSPTTQYMTTLSSLFSLVNFLVFAFGLADLGMGLWFRIDPKVYEIHKYIETQNFTIAGWIMLFCGFAACLMALLGPLATRRRAAGLLIVYFSLALLLTLAFVGTIVLLTVYGFGSKLELFLVKEIYEQLRRRSMNSELDLVSLSDAAQFIDFVQVKMPCCGATDFKDYAKLGMVVPTTCYAAAQNYINTMGCGRAIRNLLDLRAGLATGFTLGSVVAQLFATILSAVIFCAIYGARTTPKHTAPREADLRAELHPRVYLQRPRSRTPIAI